MPPSKGCFYLFAAGSESLPPGQKSLWGGAWLGEPPAQAPPHLPARREQRGIISNGVNLSAEFNATTGFN